MKLIPTVVISVALITFSSCTPKKQPRQYPADFSFVLETTEFKYESKTKKYTYYDQSIIVALTDAELTEIYKYAKDIDYLHFPNEFKCDGDDHTIPCFFDHLEVRYDNKYKRSTNDDCCPKIEKERPADFNRLVGKITDILDSKEQVKKLPKYNFLYM